MKRAVTYSLILGAVVATTGGAMLMKRHAEQKDEICALGVRNHLARMAVAGPGANAICAGLIARHPEYWQPYVAARVVRTYETQESTVGEVCQAYWAPHLYLVYDVNYQVMIGSYGRNLCDALEDHDPATRL